MRIPVRAAPTLRNARRLLGGPATIEDVAFERDILCPAEKSELRPALFLGGQLEKVLGTAPATSLSLQLDHTTRLDVVHAPTVAYHLKNSIIFDGSIYQGRMKRLVYDKAFAKNKQTFNLKIAALCNGGAPQFGHWLCDDCVTYLAAETYKHPLCLSTSFGRLPHKASYEEYFNQDWSPTDRSHVDHLIVFQDYAQNSFKKKRYHELRTRLFKRFPPSEPKHLIYLRRGSTGNARPFHNEDEIVDELSRRGFAILDIVADSLPNILSYLVAARLVISIEGSQLTHCCPSIPTGSGLLVLQPPNRFLAFHRGWTEAIGVQYGFLVGDGSESGTTFSLKDLLKTIDLYV
jgi:Glycosyltransferase 61